MRNVQDKSCRENPNTHFMFSNPPPSESRAFYRIMCTGMVVLDRPQMKIKYGACALHAGYVGLQTHTQNI